MEYSFNLPNYLVLSTLWVQWDGVYFLAPGLQFGRQSLKPRHQGSGGGVVRERSYSCPTAQEVLYRGEGVGCEGGGASR